eukprot:scpid48509/ scgid0375/ 
MGPWKKLFGIAGVMMTICWFIVPTDTTGTSSGQVECLAGTGKAPMQVCSTCNVSGPGIRGRTTIEYFHSKKNRSSAIMYCKRLNGRLGDSLGKTCLAARIQSCKVHLSDNSSFHLDMGDRSRQCGMFDWSSKTILAAQCNINSNLSFLCQRFYPDAPTSVVLLPANTTTVIASMAKRSRIAKYCFNLSSASQTGSSQKHNPIQMCANVPGGNVAFANLSLNTSYCVSAFVVTRENQTSNYSSPIFMLTPPAEEWAECKTTTRLEMGVFLGGKSYADAMTACATVGGTLAQLHKNETIKCAKSAVREWAKRYISARPTKAPFRSTLWNSNCRFWIGQNSTATAFTPSTLGHCPYIQYNSSNPSSYTNITCGDYLSYICQRPMNDPTSAARGTITTMPSTTNPVPSTPATKPSTGTRATDTTTTVQQTVSSTTSSMPSETSVKPSTETGATSKVSAANGCSTLSPRSSDATPTASTVPKTEETASVSNPNVMNATGTLNNVTTGTVGSSSHTSTPMASRTSTSPTTSPRPFPSIYKSSSNADRTSVPRSDVTMSPLMNNTGNTGQAFKPTSNIMDWLLGGSCIALLIVLVAVGCVLWKRHKAKGQYPLEAEGNLVLENIRQQDAPHDPVQDDAARYVVTGMVNEGSYAAIGADINVRSSTTETAESYYVNARPSREVPQRQNGGVQVAIKPEPASTTADTTEATKAAAEAPATATAEALGAAGAEIAPVAAATTSQSAIGQYSLITYGLAEDMAECAYDNHIRRGPPSPRFGQTTSPSPYEDRYDNHHLLLITGFGPTGVNVSPRASRVDEGLYDNEVIRSQV